MDGKAYYDYSERLLKFVINAQMLTLPTPDNLRRWKAKRDVVCGLYGEKEVTLHHILGGCSWVRLSENKLIREDRYTWPQQRSISVSYSN